MTAPTTEPPAPRALFALGSLGWLAVAGGASLGAGAIHAAAIGVHSEHRQAVITFSIVAAIQLGWGAIVLTRPGKVLLWIGAAANLAIFGGWVLAKTKGISFIDGMEVAEDPQRADATAAGLALLAVLATVAHFLPASDRALRRMPALTGTVAILVAGAALPGMVAAGGHSHEGGDHAHTEEEAGPPPVVPPKEYDPDLPIDLSGVSGVSLVQQARAEKLLTVTIDRLPQFDDVSQLEALGFRSIGDGALGHEHYLNTEYMRDDVILDPDRPESLVFDTRVTPKKLVAAMYMLRPDDGLDDVPDVGGKLTQWHIHNNLCFAPSGQVAGLTDSEGGCADGLSKGTETPMMHVWIEPHPCGPFASLEGIAAGQVADGDTRACDHVHGST